MSLRFLYLQLYICILQCFEKNTDDVLQETLLRFFFIPMLLRGWSRFLF
uniref:Uncharacterized protein n=1 Tax=Anguilla anguilla TaxID=7936 RepID=A0A0E9WP10_ANGAN